MIEGGRRTEGDLRPYPAQGEKAGGLKAVLHSTAVSCWAHGCRWWCLGLCAMPGAHSSPCPRPVVPAASWHHGGCLPCSWERLAGVHSHVVTPPQQEEMGWKGWIFLPSPPGQPSGRLGRGRVPAASAAHAYPHKHPDRLGDLT